jgi:hypothetical protein
MEGNDVFSIRGGRVEDVYLAMCQHHKLYIDLTVYRRIIIIIGGNDAVKDCGTISAIIEGFGWIWAWDCYYEPHSSRWVKRRNSLYKQGTIWKKSTLGINVVSVSANVTPIVLSHDARRYMEKIQQIQVAGITRAECKSCKIDIVAQVSRTKQHCCPAPKRKDHVLLPAGPETAATTSDAVATDAGPESAATSQPTPCKKLKQSTIEFFRTGPTKQHQINLQLTRWDFIERWPAVLVWLLPVLCLSNAISANTGSAPAFWEYTAEGVPSCPFSPFASVKFALFLQGASMTP